MLGGSLGDATGSFKFTEENSRVGHRFADRRCGGDAEQPEHFVELSGFVRGSESRDTLCDVSQDVGELARVASSVFSRDTKHVLKLFRLCSVERE